LSLWNVLKLLRGGRQRVAACFASAAARHRADREGARRDDEDRGPGGEDEPRVATTRGSRPRPPGLVGDLGFIRDPSAVEGHTVRARAPRVLRLVAPVAGPEPIRSWRHRFSLPGPRMQGIEATDSERH